MNRSLLYYAMPLLLVVASLFQSTASNRIEVRSVKPDLVLLLIVIGALVYGSRASLLWAFGGGLALDLFSGGPLGSSSLALMAAVLVAGIGHHTLSRFNMLVPLSAIAAATLVYGAAYIGIFIALEGITSWSALQAFQFNLVRPDLPAPLWATLFWPTMQIIVVPALFYNMALMVAIIPLMNRIPELEY